MLSVLWVLPCLSICFYVWFLMSCCKIPQESSTPSSSVDILLPDLPVHPDKTDSLSLSNNLPPPPTPLNMEFYCWNTISQLSPSLPAQYVNDLNRTFLPAITTSQQDLSVHQWGGLDCVDQWGELGWVEQWGGLDCVDQWGGLDCMDQWGGLDWYKLASRAREGQWKPALRSEGAAQGPKARF